MSVKDPKKLARDVFRQYGGKVQRKGDHGGTVWQFPDGACLELSPNVSMGWVTAQIRNLENKYGPRAHKRSNLIRRSGQPRIDFGVLVASEHAKDRLTLMRRQANVEFGEVLNALRIPEKVLWSDVHESWLWIRDRIAVAVTADGRRITTVMWSTPELFEMHPRPKESA